MAAIANSAVRTVYTDNLPGGERVSLLSISSVTTADTIDTSTVGPISYSRLKAGIWVPAGVSGATAVGVVGTLSNGATGVNNKVTITLTSLASDTILLLLMGEA